MSDELSKSETEQKIIGIIRGALGLEDNQEIKPKHQLVTDLGGDSLDVTEMVVDIEDAFGIGLSDDLKWEKFTVADVIRLVNEGLDKKRLEEKLKALA